MSDVVIKITELIKITRFFQNPKYISTEKYAFLQDFFSIFLFLL